MVEHRKGHSTSVLALVFVAGLILGGAVTAYVLYTQIDAQINTLKDNLSTIEGQVSAISGNQTIIVQNGTIFLNGSTAYSEIYENVKDSIVLITGTLSTGTTGTETVQGSGFIYNLTGSMVVVTNNHVVSGTTSVNVAFSDGNAYAATINGTDPYSDLAVLSVVGVTQAEFKPLQIGDSSSLKVGEPVIAIGNPYGLTGSMTTGIISALGRTIPEQQAGGFLIANIIQTSAPINPGNSGGPLLNLNGTVLGITTAIVENSQGLGFAVPSNTILKEVSSLAQYHKYTAHSYLGVFGSDMDYDTAQSMHVNVTYGWIVKQVVVGEPADEAGVHVNDIIVGINGTPVINGDEMMSYIEASTLPGQTVTLRVMRGSQTLSLPLRLGIRPAPSS